MDAEIVAVDQTCGVWSTGTSRVRLMLIFCLTFLLVRHQSIVGDAPEMDWAVQSAMCPSFLPQNSQNAPKAPHAA